MLVLVRPLLILELGRLILVLRLLSLVSGRLILVLGLLSLVPGLLYLVLPLRLVLLPGRRALVLGKTSSRRRRRTAFCAALPAPPGAGKTEKQDHSGDRRRTHSFRV